MLDPDRAIAFTHESDGQPPRGAGLRPGPLYGAARPRDHAISEVLGRPSQRTPRSQVPKTESYRWPATSRESVRSETIEHSRCPHLRPGPPP